MSVLHSLRIRLKVGIAVLGCLAAFGAYPRGIDAQTGEYDVKAAFLLNFAKFVEWPESAFADRSSPLVLAIVGNDPFGSALNRLISDKTIDGRALVLKKPSATDDFSNIQILFISESERQRAPAILKKVVGRSILTVSDIDAFCSMGGIIHLSKQDQRIRFEVNLGVGQSSGLNISSKLLGLARIVYSERAYP